MKYFYTIKHINIHSIVKANYNKCSKILKTKEINKFIKIIV